MFENTYCNCTEKLNTPAWCGNWNDAITKSFCILNGAFNSRFCPGAEGVLKDGNFTGDYLSSHPSVCNKSARKFSVVVMKPF